MRKILLATTALVAFAGAAHAAESPISVNVGGYVDFRAAHFNEATNNNTVDSNTAATLAQTQRRDHDFETEFRLNVSAEGKAANGIEYGGLVSLWNGAEFNDTSTQTNSIGSNAGFTGGRNSINVDQAYVWLSGGFGKVIMGDDHGASDLNVYAPLVGEGQIDGTYTDFTDPTTLAVFQPGFINEAESSTKLTYYTPKVGNENHKLQVGASYAPNFYDKGQNVVKYDPNLVGNQPIYQDFVEATAQYTGNWSPVNTVISATIATAGRGATDVFASGGTPTSSANSVVRDFTAWGIGAQAMYAGWTFGGSYYDAGRFNTREFQNKDQNVWSAGVKYEMDKVAVAANYLQGQGYYNTFAVQGETVNGDHQNYVKDFSAIGVGATYNWFPGLTTAFDAVFFNQNRADNATSGTTGIAMDKNNGHVLMVSQKIAF